MTLLLVAWDGEFTRRRVPSDDWAYKFCKRHGIRAYEAGVVGIPQHMRDYIKRQKAVRSGARAERAQVVDQRRHREAGRRPWGCSRWWPRS